MTRPRTRRCDSRASARPTARATPRLIAIAAAVAVTALPVAAQEKMQIGFLWHMHQPVYYPGENINQTQSAGRYSFSLYDVHNQRFGPYTTWPKDAVQAGLGLPNLGTQVSFSGSLVENLNNLRNAGVNGGMWNNWNAGYSQARAWTTQRGNTRMDMIGFTYHHALGPLLDTRDLRMQIKMHKISTQNTFGGAYSKGFFPAETAFSSRMIPALVAEGLQWTLFDSIHLDRSMKTYPHTNASGLFAPNKADQVNPAPTSWVQLNNLWAPSKVGAPEAYRPAYLQHVDPNTGQVNRIVGVPAARYEGNEDGRGGFGALQYQTVMDQYRQYNTDPSRPMFVVLHHDGDNHGGGSDAYYHSNFQNMVNWATGNANYNVSTIQDYLDRFPVPQSAVVHVEPGSWAGADNGDPEFKKWLGDPNTSGWSPDRNSWAVLTAAKNRVYTAEDLLGAANPQNVINNAGTAAERGWHYLTQAMASDHWYWDGTEIWDSNVTRGANLAVQQVNPALTPAAAQNETTPPTVFLPQRDAYNPGSLEFNTTPESADFKVWTYAYDVSGISSATLKYRVDADGENPLSSTQNETFLGGSEVGTWISLPMTVRSLTSPGNILAPIVRADEYSAMITGQRNVLLDYYVEAIDGKGNIARSEIQHVWVGGGGSTPGGGGFVMDGQLDPNTTLAGSNAGLSLNYSRKSGVLYVSTNAAGGGNDRFIYIARVPGVMQAANWAKFGQVARWDAFLGNEADNNWSGWFDAPAGATAQASNAGARLEGTLDLVAEFGFVPSEIYLAVGSYQTPDGGQLVAQFPASLDADKNIQAAEYLRITLGQGWNGAGNTGNWHTVANWFDGAVPNAVGAHARLLADTDAATTINLASPATVGQVTISSALAYTLSGAGPLTLAAAGDAGIEVTQGDHTIAVTTSVNTHTLTHIAAGAALRISGAVSLNGAILNKTGGGTLEITGPTGATAGGGVRVAGGLLRGPADLDGAGFGAGGGVARFESTQHLASLNIATGGSVELVAAAGAPNVIRTGSLAVAGRLDLGAGGAIVDHTGASPAQGVRDAIAAAYNGGGWDGAGGMTSTAAQMTPGRAIGFAESADIGSPALFLGEPVDSTSLLIRYTLFGDANLSGNVDIADFSLLASSFNTAGFWSRGDFNYDGTSGIGDFALLASNFNLALATSELARPVPEPLGLLGVAAAALLARRRH